MNGRTLGFLLTGLVVAATAWAQGHRQGPVVNTPPLAGTPAEKRILGVLDQNTEGRLKTFEIDPGCAEQARKHFEQAGVDGLVEVVVGDAHENVKRLKDPIDLLFLDADKEGYGSYLQTLLPLVRPGGNSDDPRAPCFDKP